MMSQQSLLKCDVSCNNVVLMMEVQLRTSCDDRLALRWLRKPHVLMLRTSSGWILIFAVEIVLTPLYHDLNSAWGIKTKSHPFAESHPFVEFKPFGLNSTKGWDFVIWSFCRNSMHDTKNNPFTTSKPFGLNSAKGWDFVIWSFRRI